MGLLVSLLEGQTFGDHLSANTPPDSPPTPTLPLPIEDDVGSALEGLLVAVSRSFRSRIRGSRLGRLGISWADDYFEQVYVVPPSVSAGLILATQLIAFEVYNAYRGQSVDWTNYVDSSAGAGVSLGSPNPPPPTATIGSLMGSTHTLTIEADGPSSISGSLVFTFANPSLTISVPITGIRSVVWPFRPERVGYQEQLEWVSDRQRSASGVEQVRALRDVPRSTFQARFVSSGLERMRMDNLLFENQARAVGWPYWHEALEVTAAVSVSDTTIQLETGSQTSHLEPGRLAVIWDSPTHLEALEVDSVGANSVTFTQGVASSFPAGSFVMFVADALFRNRVAQRRRVLALSTTVVDFLVIDNGPLLAEDLGDLPTYDTYQPTGGEERILLGGDNLMGGEEIQESFNRTTIVIDTKIGSPQVFGYEAVSSRETQKGIRTRTRADLWNLRKLLHYLHGPQVTWYLATDFEDLRLDANAASSDQAITVVDVGYVENVASRGPRNVFRIVQTDGTKSVPKLITGATKGGAGQEILSISPDTLGVTVTPAQSRRIEYVERVRLATDKVSILYENSAGRARAFFEVETALGAE